jgi:hypothetical protein
METFNLLLFISRRVLWMMWCKKHVKRQPGMLTFAYFMVYMVYMKKILHYLKYNCFLINIINAGIICKTSTTQARNRFIIFHSSMAFLMRQVCTKSVDAANLSYTTKPQGLEISLRYLENIFRSSCLARKAALPLNEDFKAYKGMKN